MDIWNMLQKGVALPFAAELLTPFKYILRYALSLISLCRICSDLISLVACVFR